MRTFYLSGELDKGDLNNVENAVNAEGHKIELAEVLCSIPAINVHGYTYRCESSIKYWLNVAGVKVIKS